MRFVDLIEKKADGFSLSKEEIEEMVNGYVDGSIPDYQMSAMCMAIRLQGMNRQETTDLTMAMMNSGEVVDLSDLEGIKVDKHSTGGVGDTTTLIVAPLVAACGGTVAKMSGRGLGHTGGTLDKIESIPGTSVDISLDRFKEIVKESGIAVIGQTANLVPADKKMYALRDVTGTVRSMPLIASSIMSKKLASGSDAILLDVKCGSGAFMRTKEMAVELARTMVDIGVLLNKDIRAIVTDMSQPLGLAVGNVLEVQDAVEMLSGRLPEEDPLYQVCMVLGEQLLMMSKLADTKETAGAMIQRAIKDGSGLEKLRRMFELQGGDASYIDVEKINELLNVKRRIDVKAESEGYIFGMNAEMIGNAAQMLGAGRAKKEDVIDPAVGLKMHVRTGMKVTKDTVLCTLYVNDESNLKEVIDSIHQGIVIESEKPQAQPLIYCLVTKDGVIDYEN